MTGMFRLVLRKMLQNVDDMLPAIVIDHDREANRVTVRPIIATVDTEDRVIQKETIAKVPVLNLGGGGFFINFNLPPGSLGWIKASDRDISLFLQSYQQERPNTLRMHNFSDSLFIPDTMTGYTIDDEDAEAMVVQNLDGSVRISLNAERIKITSPRVESVTTGDFVITADNMTVTLQNDFTMTNANTTITDTGQTTINGATIMSDGAIESPTSVTSPSVIADGKELVDHTHSGVRTGTSNSGPNN